MHSRNVELYRMDKPWGKDIYEVVKHYHTNNCFKPWMVLPTTWAMQKGVCMMTQKNRSTSTCEYLNNQSMCTHQRNTTTEKVSRRRSSIPESGMHTYMCTQLKIKKEECARLSATNMELQYKNVLLEEKLAATEDELVEVETQLHDLMENEVAPYSTPTEYM
jgi:dynactin complex subunit